MKKCISVILCAVLLICFGAGITGCGQKDDPAASVSLTSGQTYGQGANKFTLVTEDTSGKEITVTIATDKSTVGEALLDLGIIDGEDSEWGLYVKTVNSITLDYDKDGKYWAFYIDGEYAMTGVDSTDITNGSVYALRPEQ